MCIFLSPICTVFTVVLPKINWIRILWIPPFKNLSWFTVSFRIKFKILSIQSLYRSSRLHPNIYSYKVDSDFLSSHNSWSMVSLKLLHMCLCYTFWPGNAPFLSCILLLHSRLVQMSVFLVNFLTLKNKSDFPHNIVTFFLFQLKFYNIVL